jgi:hypothetical protein
MEPSATKLSSEDLAPFVPNGLALTQRLQPLVTNDMLRRIAALDYGRDQQAHFMALKALRDAPHNEVRDHWHPWEVLELGISGPPFPNYAGSPKVSFNEEEDAITHTFVLACLLQAAPALAGKRMDSIVLHASSRLLKKCDRVPQILPGDIASVFAWLLESHPTDEDLPFLAVWLVYAGLSRRLNIPQQTIEKLVIWAHATETDWETGRDRQGMYFDRDVNFPVWRVIGLELRRMDLAHLPTETCTKINDIATLLEA